MMGQEKVPRREPPGELLVELVLVLVLALALALAVEGAEGVEEAAAALLQVQQGGTLTSVC